MDRPAKRPIAHLGNRARSMLQKSNEITSIAVVARWPQLRTLAPQFHFVQCQGQGVTIS
jgi:hypothetical protein